MQNSWTTTPERRYHTIIFDVGGTLIGFEDDTPFEQFLATVEPPHRFVTGGDLRSNMIRTLSRRRHEAIGLGLNDQAINNWWHTIFDELFPSNPKAAQSMWELFKQNYFDSLFPDTLPTLQRFKVLGIPMGIISNYGTHLLDLLPRLKIFGFFDFIIVSAIVGVVKPDPKIFEMGIEAAGVPADQILYIGDNFVDDIQGANRMGIDAVLINRPGREPEQAPHMINSLQEIERIIFPRGTYTPSAPESPLNLGDVYYPHGQSWLVR